MTKSLKVLIGGGGIGGLTSAIALLRQGFDVEIYEQAQVLGELGAGLQISANGTRLLIELGLEDALSPLICEAAAKEVRMWDSGQRWPLFDLGDDSVARFGAPYWMIHRGDLHRVLRETVEDLKPGAVHLGQQCMGFEQNGDGVTLITNKTRAQGDVLIGADGVHSRLAKQLFQTPEARFTGLMAWRGLAPMEAIPPEARRPVGTNWVGPGAHVITYPIRGGELLNFVGIVENTEWKSESWTEAGTIKECLADFQGWNPLLHDIIPAVGTVFRWALAERTPLEQWCDGRVALLGDACHSTLPFLAQGAVMAIEDAFVLAACLKAKTQAPQEALATYHRLRVKRATDIVIGSGANVDRFHNPALADPEKAVAYVEEQWQPDKVRQRYDWLFEYDATKLDVT